MFASIGRRDDTSANTYEVQIDKLRDGSTWRPAGAEDLPQDAVMRHIHTYIQKKSDKLRKFELKMDWSETRSMEMGC